MPLYSMPYASPQPMRPIHYKVVESNGSRLMNVDEDFTSLDTMLGGGEDQHGHPSYDGGPI